MYVQYSMVFHDLSSAQQAEIILPLPDGFGDAMDWLAARKILLWMDWSLVLFVFFFFFFIFAVESKQFRKQYYRQV